MILGRVEIIRRKKSYEKENSKEEGEKGEEDQQAPITFSDPVPSLVRGFSFLKTMLGCRHETDDAWTQHRAYADNQGAHQSEMRGIEAFHGSEARIAR